MYTSLHRRSDKLLDRSQLNYFERYAPVAAREADL